MANAKPNTKIFDILFNKKTLMPLSLGSFIGEVPASLQIITPLGRACNQIRSLIILSLAFATSASLFILFEYNSQVVLLKTPYYLVMDVKIFQKV